MSLVPTVIGRWLRKFPTAHCGSLLRSTALWKLWRRVNVTSQTVHNDSITQSYAFNV